MKKNKSKMKKVKSELLINKIIKIFYKDKKFYKFKFKYDYFKIKEVDNLDWIIL